MVIYNEMGVRVFVMLKKSRNEFNRYPLCIIISDRCYENNEHFESSTKVAFGTFGSLCITGFEEFDKQKLRVAEIVNPFNTFQMENCSVVITYPSPKYLKIDQVYNNKATLKSVMEQ
ncbi:hypothetical protein R3W88_031840 [Solanum pinnatisectum]|uniref:Uncharacterized protein n=1 Tax=Solanum pinnatisectum TaxID=50273 RepID=A0AAV9LMS5_9SOLN|nr:hypothetical protein R3W88_031840 [Solanum pinnatisectum]